MSSIRFSRPALLLLTALAGVLAVSIWAVVGVTANPAPGTPAAKPLRTNAAQPELPPRLVVHEWGTFTSFSGSSGVGVPFLPEGNDLPKFVYTSDRFGLASKSPGPRYVAQLVSMETPVLYFYPDREMTASVSVQFPRGYLTEWYPQAQYQADLDSAARRLTWKNFRLLPGAHVGMIRDKRDNHYFAARETDAAPLEVAMNPALETNYHEERGYPAHQYEKFLFYRGVGSFPVPLGVRALDNGRFTVTNNHKDRIAAVFAVHIHNGTLSFRELGGLDGGAELTVEQPRDPSSVTELGSAVARVLTAQGLFEKESQAMVKTWSRAWFGEEGTRFLYLLPARMTDELLPLQVEPKPTAVVRVMVGRHDILTPEREQQLDVIQRKLQALQAETAAAQKALGDLRLGRFMSAAVNQANARMKPGR
jgi:hypothetical protein